ncbi:hypothetical protein IEO21_09191 [Rhodonia placenta]|uniref:Uncharacterized protein n=1 Tax=Rhodonia placenta TaxID=104341 RepID=A0A8H7NUW7_9APHY|nr:hypothetical protein IEO21_09191 [Postia placenta]
MSSPAYTGQILCRFERSTLPKHAQRRVIVLRVLEIIEPIHPIVPGYDCYLEPPVEGALLWRGRKPISIDIDGARFKDPSNPLKVLCGLCHYEGRDVHEKQEAMVKAANPPAFQDVSMDCFRCRLG